MLSIKFLLNPTYGLGGDVLRWIPRWLPWQPSWISEPNDFSNSESLFHSDASHQVAAQLDLLFGRNFILEWNDFSNSESLYRSNASHQVSAQSDFRFWRRCHLKSGHLGYQNGMILAILNLYVTLMPPIYSNFDSVRLTVWEVMLFEEFQDARCGHHLG